MPERAVSKPECVIAERGQEKGLGPFSIQKSRAMQKAVYSIHKRVKAGKI
jgi:hypothetical protein